MVFVEPIIIDNRGTTVFCSCLTRVYRDAFEVEASFSLEEEKIIKIRH